MNTLKAFTRLVSISGILFFCSMSFAQAESLPRMYTTYAYQGSWEDIGRQTALHFRDTIITTGFVFNNFIGIGADEARDYYEAVKHLIPAEIIEQMQGIALGLNEYWSIPYDTAWAWTLITNVGFDIINLHQREEETVGCTAFALHSEDGTFLCHNTDNMEANLDMGSLIHYLPDNGDNSFLSFFSPAFVGAALAINAQGLALVYNVGGRNKNPAAGLPVLLKTRQVMAECDNLTQAVDSFTAILDEGGTYGYSTANFLIFDFKDASMARLQVSSDDIKVTYGQELKEGVTYIAFTNEFDDDFSPRDLEGSDNDSSSVLRYRRLVEILPEFEKYDIETCWEILSDSSDGQPTNDTICRRGETNITTLTNIFTDTTAYYSVGPPCEYLPEYDDPMAVDLEQMVKPSIVGTVTAMDRPLGQAKVLLESISGGGISLKTYSDEDGTFVFNNLESCSYRIQVKKFLHVPKRVFVDYKKGEKLTVDINLFF
jgi:hypothetical protein